MFATSPALRPRQPDHDVPARRALAAASATCACALLDLASGTACCRPPQGGTSADLDRPLVPGCSPPLRAHRHFRVTCCACRARPRRRRRDVQVRAAQPHRPGVLPARRVLGRAAGSRCSTSAVRRNKVIRFGNDIYSRGDPQDRRPTPTERRTGISPRASPTSRPMRWCRRCARRVSPTPHRLLSVTSSSPHAQGHVDHHDRPHRCTRERRRPERCRRW